MKKSDSILNELHDLYNQNTNLYILSHQSRICANQIRSTVNTNTSIYIGGSYSLAWGAAGHAILAYMKNEELLEILDKAERKTPGFIKRFNLNSELDKIRNQGYAFQEGILEEDIVCISAPFFDKDGDVQGCVSVSGPKMFRNC